MDISGVRFYRFYTRIFNSIGCSSMSSNAIISGVAEEIDLSPIAVNDETRQDMKAISELIHRGTKEGLLVEVLWSAFQHGSRNIASKCYYGLSEWDC